MGAAHARSVADASHWGTGQCGCATAGLREARLAAVTMVRADGLLLAAHTSSSSTAQLRQPENVGAYGVCYLTVAILDMCTNPCVVCCLLLSCRDTTPEEQEMESEVEGLRKQLDELQTATPDETDTISDLKKELDEKERALYTLQVGGSTRFQGGTMARWRAIKPVVKLGVCCGFEQQHRLVTQSQLYLSYGSYGSWHVLLEHSRYGR